MGERKSVKRCWNLLKCSSVAEAETVLTGWESQWDGLAIPHSHRKYDVVGEH